MIPKEFRAWALGTKSMYNYPEVNVSPDCYGNIELNDLFQENKDNYVYMQFTGLFDRFNTKIFFGDIVEYLDESKTKQIGIVTEYDFYGGYIEAINGDKEGNQDINFNQCYSEDIVIIGNIYENPELLKEN